MTDHSAPEEPGETSVEASCWSRIGFAGDGSCPELKRVPHCHNCRVFIDASRSLFERPHPPGYLEEWTQVVAQPKDDSLVQTESMLVFRLADELMAFPTGYCQVVERSCKIHSIPHLSDQILLGLATIQGEIQPVFSLAAILGLEDSADNSMLVAIRQRGEVWAFPVGTVLTIHSVDPAQIELPPATLGATHATFTRGLVRWEGRGVDVLDPDLIVREIVRRLR